MKGSAGIAQIMATIEVEQAEQQAPSTTKTAKNNHVAQTIFNKLIDNFDTEGLFLPCSIDSISTALKTSHLH